jgi:hypothetical protein
VEGYEGQFAFVFKKSPYGPKNSFFLNKPTWISINTEIYADSKSVETGLKSYGPKTLKKC